MKKITLLSLIIALFTFCNQVNAQVSNNLILHYSFDNGNALDEVGSNNGTVYGATSCPDRFGNPDMAYHFSTSSIEVATCNLGDLTEASISIWLEPDSLTFFGGIAAPVHIGGYWAIYMNRYNADGRLIGIFDQSSLNNSVSDQSNPISTNGWTHIVVTSDGSITSIYINGVLENSYSETFSWVDSQYLKLAVQPGVGGPEHYYNGKLDDFRVYGKALSTLEIDTLFNLPNSPTKINEVALNNNIRIYPNPTSVKLIVDNVDQTITEIDIIDISGKLIKTMKQNTNTISVADLSNGVYFIKLISDEGTVTKKFVKQ